jgi:DNA-binding XRE family transcriptional regulator
MTNLQTLRTAHGLTREALAQKAGVHSQTIAAHEYGKANDVMYSIAKRLSDALETPVESLFLPEPTDLRIEMAQPQATA